jgi:CubicO group peptidase (beta-lactamase class C family)
MAVGDCQREFAMAAAEDGIELSRQSFGWLSQQGHLALPESAAVARHALQRIYLALGGDLEVLAAGRSTMLRGDFFHDASRTLIEIDESQHFTSARLTTLDFYPEGLDLGFELEDYRAHCQSWRAKSDGYYRAKAARGFGAEGRQRQRAYYDALRDISAPAMGYSIIRIAATNRDGRAAYLAHREHMLELAAHHSGGKYPPAPEHTS